MIRIVLVIRVCCEESAEVDEAVGEELPKEVGQGVRATFTNQSVVPFDLLAGE